MARNDKGNVILEEGFSQVCIWPATVVGEARINEFVQFIEEELNARAQFLEEVLT